MCNPMIDGRVHYVSLGTPVQEDGTQVFTSQCRAALITATHDDSAGELLSLSVQNPTGGMYAQKVAYSQDDTVGGTWHWNARPGA